MESKKILLGIALHIFKDFEREWAQYESDCDLSYRHGYRPSRCFHGTNLWTDYDPMCGPCEDGLGWFDREAYRKISLDMARRDLDEFYKRLQIYTQLQTNNVPGIDYGQLIEWVGEPVNKHRVHDCNAYVGLSLNNPPF